MTKQKTSENFIDAAISIIEKSYHDMKKAGLDAPNDSESYEENLSTLRAWGKDMKSKGAEYCNRYALNILSAAGEYWSKTLVHNYSLYKTREVSEELSQSEREEAEKLCLNLIMINNLCITYLSNIYTKLRSDNLELIFEDIAKHSSKLASKERIDKVFSLMLVNDAILCTEWEDRLFIALYSFVLIDKTSEENENKINDIFIAYLKELGYKIKDKKKKYFSFRDCFSSSEPSTQSEQLLLSDYEESGAELVPVEDKAEKLQVAKIIPAERFLILKDAMSRTIFNKKSYKLESRIEKTVKNVKLYSFDFPNIKTGEDISIFCRVDFKALEENGIEYDYSLDTEDREIFTILTSLQEAGNKYVSYNDIYRALGGKGNLNKSTSESIDASVDKISLVTISTTNEAEEGSNYEQFKVKFPLLAIKKITGVRKGGEIDTLLVLGEKSQLVEIAKDRGQLFYLPKECLSPPMKRTPLNRKILYYLIEKIQYITYSQKNKKRSSHRQRILFDTMYKELGISEDKEAKRRAKKKVFDILDYYNTPKGKETKEEHIGYIYGYTADEKGITLLFPKSALK